MESFAPGVMVDGKHVEPEAWMWVLAFAIGGCQWAIDIAKDPEYDMRGKIDDYMRRQQSYERQRKIAYYESLLAELKTLEGE